MAVGKTARDSELLLRVTTRASKENEENEESKENEENERRESELI